MIPNILTKIFGSRNERLLKQYAAGRHALINARLSRPWRRLSDAELTREDRRVQGSAWAMARDARVGAAPESIRRRARSRLSAPLQMRHFDVQLLGRHGALHHGKIAEMRTGEGKTLVADAARVPQCADRAMAYTSSLSTTTWRSATPSGWGGSTASSGLTVGVILSQMAATTRAQAAYAADITYGTNNEFGFDYLRDNMVFALGDSVQRGLHYAIVDEVDSILIDEARTPLIISGQADDNIDLYYRLERTRAAARRGKPKRRRPATTGSTRRRTRCCCPRRDTSTPRASSLQRGPAPPGRSLYDAPQHLADAPPVRGAAGARACSTATSTTSCRTAR